MRFTGKGTIHCSNMTRQRSQRNVGKRHYFQTRCRTCLSAGTSELRSSAVRVASLPGSLFMIGSKCQQLSTMMTLVRVLRPGASERESERESVRELQRHDAGWHHSPPSLRLAWLADASGWESAAPSRPEADFTRFSFSERRTTQKKKQKKKKAAG